MSGEYLSSMAERSLVRKVAGGSTLVWSSTLVIFGVFYLAVLVGSSMGARGDSCDYPEEGYDARCSTYIMLNAVPALEVMVVNGFGVAASIGLLGGRPWARPTVVTLFVLLGVLVIWWPWIGNVVEWSWPDRVDLATVLAALLPPVSCLTIYCMSRQPCGGRDRHT